ncbi:hypothetical protein [Ponticaulis sp.]|uniref:hypothetical protein n=1 Tax=Ponticaulis sp. TaxID=2020902 RepID=UPI002617DD02|nr:hypothetical protein [Ponticaulis sp.]MDF1678931.1 hypothetical protein [Ponticaulis sp.]
MLNFVDQAPSVVGAFCLIGLVGLGSIPIHIICLGGLLTFIALWALAFVVDLSTSNGKEHHMETGKTKFGKLKSAARSLANTTLATGASMWSGLALSSKALELE